MKALILAAGYATRLYPLTRDFPKPLLPVGGKPILDWLLDDLRRHTDIRETVLVSNHRFAQKFAEWAQTRGGVTVLDDGTESNETRLGAVRDMRLALDSLAGEDALVMAGDNLLDFSLAGFVAFVREKQASCVMCHRETELARLRKTAVITVDAAQRITSYEEKPAEPKGELAVPPFYCYRAEELSQLDAALAAGCGADAPGSFAAWLSRRVPMYAWPMPGRRHDIGDLASYQQAQALWATANKEETK